MTGYKRHAKNASKLVLMFLLSVVTIAVLLPLFAWPLLLWFTFGESLALAVAVTVVWIVALLGL